MLTSLGASPLLAQTTGTLAGRVADPLGAGVSGAQITLTNAVTGFTLTALTDTEGVFRFTNLPLQHYRLKVEAVNFRLSAQDLDLRTSVPASVEVVLEISGQADAVTVLADDPGALVDPARTGTRTGVSFAMVDRMPSAIGSRGLEAVLVSFPGFAQNANGAIHPRGAHNQMTYLVDGLPITDQLTGAFANALDTGMVQTIELMTGNIPAEFGAKIAGVAVVTTRSGLQAGRSFSGEASLRAGGFDTRQGSVRLAGQRGPLGYFGTATAMRTDRFLDQVSLDNLHNAGDAARAFVRLDIVLPGGDLLRASGMGGRSWFELANLRSQHASGRDQRQRLGDSSGWVTHLATLGPRATLETTAAYRATTAHLLPSAGDVPITAAQDRRLSTFTASTRYTHVAGRHHLRTGADVQRFPVRESFTLGITDPDFNDPASHRFNEALLPHDLTRGGRPFAFQDERAGLMVSAFVQDAIRWDRLTATLGVRFDEYRFLVNGRQVQPRVGVAWWFPSTATSLRASYNRTFQTPPNENLLLSSSEAASRLAPASVRDALGGTHAPIQPERQHVFEAGVQQALFGRASLDVSAYYKRARDQQDNNDFFDTGIVFPTALQALSARGLEARLTVPPVRGASGTISLTTSRAISTPPFTGGLFLGQDAVDLLTEGPFAIDHDQRLSVHSTIHHAFRRGLWAGASVRYDSGLVSNPSDPEDVAADPDFADLLPYVDLTSDVPRVRPRTIVDAVLGYDLFRQGRRHWSARLQVNNVLNRTALFNFQSVFVGTRLVQPRTVSAELRYHW